MDPQDKVGVKQRIIPEAEVLPDNSSSKQEKDKDTHNRVAELALACFEIFGLILANIGTVFLINLIPAVREEYHRLYEVLFGEKQVKKIDLKEEEDKPQEGKEGEKGNPVDLARKVNQAQKVVVPPQNPVDPNIKAEDLHKPVHPNPEPKKTNPEPKKTNPEPKKTNPDNAGGPDPSKVNPQPVPQPKAPEKPSAKSEGKTQLDSLTPEERDQKVRELQVQLNYRAQNKLYDVRVINQHYKEFSASFEEGKKIALKLHQEFSAQYVKEGSPGEEAPTYNDLNRSVISSLFQLKMAIAMAKKAFPGLMVLAYSDEQKSAIAQLIQIILCGDQVKKTPGPGGSCCFSLIELEGKYTPEEIYISDPVHADNTYFYNFLMTHGEGNLEAGLHRVAKDFIARFEGCKKGQIMEFVSQVMAGMCESFKDSPKEMQHQIEDYKTSSLMTQLGKKDGDQLPNVREKLAPALEKAKSDKALKSVVDELPDLFELIKCNEYKDILITTAKNKINLELSAEELQRFFDIKFLEIMILMNKQSSQLSTDALQSILTGYGDGQVFNKIWAQGYLFYRNANCVKTQTIHNLTVGASRFLEEGITDVFSSEAVVAQVLSSEEMTGIHLPENASDGDGPLFSKKYTPIITLAFSWQASNKMMDYLAGRVDLKAVNGQPAQRFALHSQEMEESCQKLNQIAQRCSQRDAPSIMARVMSMWSPTSTKETTLMDEVAEDIAEAGATLNTASERLEQFLRTALLSNQIETKVNPPLASLRASLEGLHKALAERQAQLAAAKHLSKSEEFTAPLQQVRRLLSQIDEKKVEGKTVLERFKGVFSQTESHKEISWKVKRYEEQILQLKALFENNFAEELKEEVNRPASEFAMSTLSNSWIHVDAEKGAVVRVLYRSLLRAVSKIEKNKETYKANRKERYTQNHLDHVREGYNDFLKLFRSEFSKEMAEGGLDDEKRQYLEKVGMLLYTGLSLRDRSMRTLRFFNKIGAQVNGQDPGDFSRVYAAGEESSHPVVQEVETLYERMNAAPYTSKAPLINQLANSVQGQYNRNFDPNLQSNPMHVLYKLRIEEPGKPARTKLEIGMGCPTREDIFGNLVIVEEWRATMQGYKRAGLRHLYTSNQNLIPVEGIKKYVIDGDETQRANAIMDLQKDPSVKGAFFAITLSKNSPFYNQTGMWMDIKEAKNFKESLLREVFDTDPKVSGNWISDEVKELCPNLKDNAKHIIDYIHDRVFEGKKELSLEERKRFIDFFHTKLVRKIEIQGEFYSSNKTCKDGIDRAADSTAQSFSEDAITCAHQTGNGNISPKDQELAQNLILFRAMSVRKRPILHERFERFKDSYNFRLKHGKELLGLHQDIFQNITITPI